MTLNKPLSTLITIQACHPTFSTQPRSLSTTVKQTKTICISSDSITAKSEYCAPNFPRVSITEHFFSKTVTENRFIFQKPNQACHDSQKEQIARYNNGK